MSERSRSLARCMRWLRVLAPLVPAARRREWLEEWQAELANRIDGAHQARRQTQEHPRDEHPRGWHLARDASGALFDALWLAYEPWRPDPMLEDLRHAWRTLTRHPAFSIVAVLTLAIGIGVTTAIVAAVDVVLLRPLPYPQPERLVALWESNPDRGWHQVNAAPANALDWRDQSTLLDDVALRMFSPTASIVATSAEEAVRANGLAVSGNYFDVLGVSAVRGRTLAWDETWATGTKPVVLGHGLWQRSFGGRDDVVGSTIRVDGEPSLVVGIMPEGFRGPSATAEFWTSMNWDPAFRTATWFRRAHFVWPVARLAPGATVQQARAELEAIAQRLATDHPETNEHMGAGMTPLHTWQTGDTRRPLLVLLGAVAVVLLIACANVANLLLVRATRRGREMAVRRALGASRMRLSRQLFAEGLLLAAAAALVGVISASGMVVTLKTLAPAGLPRLTDIAVDGRVVGLAGLLALGSTLIFALVPAWVGARGSHAPRLRGSDTSGHTGQRARAVLVVAEVALALALLVGLGLLSRSLQALYRVDLGFDPDRVMAVKVELPEAMFPGDDTISSETRRAALFDRLEVEIAALPGVSAVAATSGLPVSGQRWTGDYAVAGRPREAFGVEVGHVEVAPGLFRTLATPLLQGRDFTTADDADSEPVVIVNETWAREAFPGWQAGESRPPGRQPLGTRVSFDRYPSERSTWYTVVGVVADLRHERVVKPARAMIYQPIRQDPSSHRYLALRADDDPLALVPAIRKLVHDIDPTLPLMEVTTFDALIAESVANERLVTILLACFGFVAGLLAMVGTYGTIAFVTNQRRRELAIRMAVGAQRGEVVRLVLGRGLRWIGYGLVAGLVLAWGGSRFLGSLLFEVDASDPTTYGTVAALLALAGLLACWLPARRAAGHDPSTTLRAD